MIENSISSTRTIDLLTKADTNIQDCGLCEKEFYSKTELQEHMESHLTHDSDFPYQRHDCGKGFSMAGGLARHNRSHTLEKPYTCPVCHKGFSMKENLSVHQRSHTQERPYPCPVCQRSFEHSGKLHRHMRIHTGERPHQCGMCDKTFIQSGQLVIHMRTHTGEKPYSCMSCSKGFTCSKQLKVHMRTHTGEKPYNCDICGKSFGYNHVLKLHQVAHFGERVYKCTICKNTFNNKKQLDSHIKTHEDEFPELCLSPGRPSSVGSSCSETTSSDKENSSIYHPSSVHHQVEECLKGIPPPAHLSSRRSLQASKTPIDAQFILPSINSICPGEVLPFPTIHNRPTLKLTETTFNTPSPRSSSSPRRTSCVFPVTASLMKNLIMEDLAQYGPPTAIIRNPITSEMVIKASSVVPSISSPPPLSVSMSTPSSPTRSVSPTFSMMTESSLPLRKRRLAFSESSTDEPIVKSPRGSVIMFATRS